MATRATAGMDGTALDDEDEIASPAYWASDVR